MAAVISSPRVGSGQHVGLLDPLDRKESVDHLRWCDVRTSGLDHLGHASLEVDGLAIHLAAVSGVEPAVGVESEALRPLVVTRCDTATTQHYLPHSTVIDWPVVIVDNSDLQPRLDVLYRAERRHRLNRGGDRQANAALYIIVICRLRWDQRTQAYMAKRLAEGKTRKEAIRCLKRYVTREIYGTITRDLSHDQHLDWPLKTAA